MSHIVARHHYSTIYPVSYTLGKHLALFHCNTTGENCKAIDGGNIFAGVHVVNVGRKAFGGEVFADTRVVIVGCEAIGEGKDVRVTDVGHEAVDGDDIFAGAQVIGVGHEADNGNDEVLAGSEAVDKG